MPNPLPGAWSFLSERLKGDSQLVALAVGGVHRDSAPDTGPDPVVYPLVVAAITGTKLVRAVGGGRLASEVTCLVRGITQGRDMTTLAAMAQRIDAALLAPDDPVAVSFGGVNWLMRGICDEDHWDSGPEEGVLYESMGGVFRLFIEEA